MVAVGPRCLDGVLSEIFVNQAPTRPLEKLSQEFDVQSRKISVGTNGKWLYANIGQCVYEGTFV